MAGVGVVKKPFARFAVAAQDDCAAALRFGFPCAAAEGGGDFGGGAAFAFHQVGKLAVEVHVFPFRRPNPNSGRW